MSLDERKQMWQERIEAYRSSDEPSVKAWCKSNQVGLQSMYQWMRRLQHEATHVAPSSTQWVAVESSNVFDKTTSPLIVKMGDVSIGISEGFDRALFTEVLHADETTLQVLSEPGRKADSKSYMWMYRTGRDVPANVLYDYQSTRHSKHPKAFLKDFKGYLHVDGYAGYHDLKDVELVGCWAHSRRKFDEALKSLPANVDKKSTVAAEGLQYCNQLFQIERQINEEFENCSPEKRKEQRLKHSKPVLEVFLAWLKAKRPQVPPKSKLGEAITYTLNQWSKLIVFLKDGRLEIDNNRAERSIKPFVMGRKAWMFAQSMKGAKASAIIYSIVETAKENQLNPLNYLTYLFEQLPLIDVNDMEVIDHLLIWSETVTLECRIPNKVK